MSQVPMFQEQSPAPIKSNLSLKYTGPATKNHSIDAELYAKSLLGFSTSFKKASKRLTGIEIGLDIRAEKPGSIEVLVDFFSRKDIVAGAAVLAYLQFFGIDMKIVYKLPLYLFKLIINIIKRCKGNKEKIRQEIESLELPTEVIERTKRLIENNDYRIDLDEMTEFLKEIGMESLEVIHDGDTECVITQRDRQYFVAQPEDETTVEIDEKVVSITYISPEKHRWQFKSGSSEFWADVKDHHFINTMQDKALEEIIDLQFTATIEKTSTREANTKRSKTSRTISEFKQYLPPKQGKLLP